MRNCDALVLVVKRQFFARPWPHAQCFFAFPRKLAVALLALSMGVMSCALAAHAPRWNQMGDHVFQFFSTDKGLPHPVVMAMAEDHDGMLWVGTQGGLARWDGYRFRSYQPDQRQENSLPDNFIQVLHIDPSGTLWIGTSGGGLARYQRRQDNFQTLPLGVHGVSHVAVHALADDERGGLWIATNAGLDHLNLKTNQFRHFNIQPETVPNAGQPAKTDAAAENPIHALLNLPGRRLLIGTAKGLFLAHLEGTLNAPRMRIEAIPVATPNHQMLAVRSLMLAADGTVWIGSSRHGVFLMRQGKVEALHQLLPAASQLQQDFVISMVQLQNGLVWLGTYGQGVVSVDMLNNSVTRLKNDPLQPTGLADDTVWSLLRGKGGFLWLGNQRGLQLHDAGQMAVLTMFGTQQRKNGLSEADVFSIAPMRDGSIWLGTGTQGIDRIDPRDSHAAEEKRLLGIRPNPKNPLHSLPSQRILGMLELGNEVYVGTGLGLYRVQQTSLAVEKLTATSDNTVADVRSIIAQGRKLLFGGSQGGLWWRDLAAPASQIAQRPPGISALSDQRIVTMSHADAGRVWIGTRNGLNLYDLEKGVVETILPNPADEHGLSAGLILSLMTDQRGRLWVGTLGGGICILEGRDSHGRAKFRQLGIENGLPHLNVSKILQDKQGMIWVSTDNGLAQINPEDFSIRSLQAAEGVPITAFWGNSGAMTASGELLFGGTGGMVIVRPQYFQEWRYQPPIVTTEIRVMGKPVPALQFNRAYRHQAPAALILQPGNHHLSVEFAALDYSAPERLHYMYRLDGYDKDWIETEPNRRLAAYTNLPPGQFHLHLRGSNRLGSYPEQNLVIPISVLPAWYQTWWFSLLQVVGGLLAVSLLLRISTRYLRLRQRELETQVSQRTAQLEDKQEQLLSANHGLNRANQELENSAETLRLLGDVGRDITANLDADKVFDALHLHVGNLLDASSLVIYRKDASGKKLSRCFGREAGKALPVLKIPLDTPNSTAAKAVRERQEILLERSPAQAQASGKRPMLTSLFAPLIIDTQVLGVMAIQSERAHAYGERERMIFRTLCAYGAIALANVQVLAALHAAQEQLVQQEKLASLGGLVTGVAHEINTPLGVTILALTGIQQSWQEFFSRHPSLQAEASDALAYTEMALHNANRAAALITSFQAVTARFDSDLPDELDLSHYLPEVAALLQTEMQQHGQQLQIDVPEGLRVQTVAAALTEVMGRILANVHDHAFAAGQVGKVLIKAQRLDEDWIEIIVQDNGIGIPAEALPKVFDPFFSSASGSSGHVGLGLHIAFNHVTQRLHGRILIDSELQHGTRLSIRLPRYFPSE